MFIPSSILFASDDKVNAAYLSLISLYGTFIDKPDNQIFTSLNLPKRSWIRLKKQLMDKRLITYTNRGIIIKAIPANTQGIRTYNHTIDYKELRALKVQVLTNTKRINHLTRVFEQAGINLETKEDLFKRKLWFMRHLSIAHKWDGGNIQFQFVGNLFLRDIMHVFKLNSVASASKFINANPYIEVVTEGKYRAQRLHFKTKLIIDNDVLRFYEKCMDEVKRIERAFFKKVIVKDGTTGLKRPPTLKEFRKWFFDEFKHSKWEVTKRIGFWVDADGNVVAKINYTHYFRKVPLIELVDKSNEKHISVVDGIAMEQAMVNGELIERIHTLHMGTHYTHTPDEIKPVTKSHYDACLHLFHTRQ